MQAQYVNHMGDDLMVVNAARVSFDKESSLEFGFDSDCRGQYTLAEKDAKLINYLATHGHWTPFSHPQITIRETVPIFVARQRFKHMVGFTYNEVSRRYVDDTPEFFVPEHWRARPDASIKQGSGTTQVTEMRLFGHTTTPNEHYDEYLYTAQTMYTKMLEAGIAPEQARMVLPQSMYTSYYVTGSLAAWARAYKQRIDPHSQKEIQDLAKQWGEILQPLFPASWEALTK